MSVDTELESLRQDWCRDTEPLPELRRRIRRQDLRMAVGVALLLACLLVAAALALRHPHSSWPGFVAGLSCTALLAGGYTWWVRRNAWVPAAQTTQAYLELLHRRAVADLRKTRFLTQVLLAGLVLYAIFALWQRDAFHARSVLILAAGALEWLFLKSVERRRARAVAVARDKMDEARA